MILAILAIAVGYWWGDLCDLLWSNDGAGEIHMREPVPVFVPYEPVTIQPVEE